MGVSREAVTRIARGERQALIRSLVRDTQNLKAAVSEMEAGFREARAERASKAHEDRLALLQTIRHAVSAMKHSVERMPSNGSMAQGSPPAAGRRPPKTVRARRTRNADK